MSTFRNPVGPQSRSVYWRRRLVLAIGLVVIIALIVLVVNLARAASSQPDPSSSSAPVDDSDTAEEPTAPADTDPVEEPVEGADCDPATVRVAAIIDSNSYSADQVPMLSFAITNTSGTSCTFNAGTTQQEFVVSSGEEVYWSSKDCETDPVDAAVLLDPNVAVNSTPLPWDRTRSSPETCDTDRPAAPAGGATYNLSVTVGELVAEPVSFLLN